MSTERDRGLQRFRRGKIAFRALKLLPTWISDAQGLHHTILPSEGEGQNSKKEKMNFGIEP